MQKFIGKMARMYPMLILMGFMIVVIAFVVGYFNSQTAAAYFAESKVVRETTLMADRASIESLGLWLPYLKFLGIGLILSGIKATSAWLVPFKFFGIATQFLAIAMGLSTIVCILGKQTEMIDRGIQLARQKAKASRKIEKEKVLA